jgi:ankyrin repeat protein
VLPRDATSWPERRRHVVLLHELAHIKRRDCLTQLLAQIVCAAYWFNPLAWIAARRLRTERERACDDFVLAAGTPGSEYASHLLDIAQARQPVRFSPLAATAVPMARRSQLEGRLMAILDPATRRSSAFYTKLAAAALIALVSIPAAAVQLVSPAPETATRGVRLQPDLPGPVAVPAAKASQGGAVASTAPQAATPLPLAKDEVLRYTLNRTLIEFADEGHVEGVRTMLDAGADPNARIEGEGSPLIAAAGEGQLEIARLLLERGADPNLIVPGDGSPLTAAADEGHFDIVRLLIDRGANPNLITQGDGSPLTAAAGEGHLDIVELLIARGADVSLVAEGDETPLIQAAGEGHLDIVKLLVSKGADVNQGVWAHERSFQVVRSSSDVERFIATAFSARFDNVDARTEPELRTPLSEARDEGHLDIVTFLIGAGARD